MYYPAVMLVIIYARISLDRLGLAEGIADQVRRCREYAAARGWTVLAVFVDDDISASRGKHRPGYAEMMAGIVGGSLQATHIVCVHQSRLWRNRKERAADIERLGMRRVSIAFVDGMTVDLASAQGRLVAGLVGEFDTAESEIKSERVAWASERRAKEGRAHGGQRPYGYAPGGMRLDPVEAAVVAELFQRFVSGTPLGALVRDLNARGVLTVTGKAWSPKTLAGVLRHARHAGLAEYRGEVVGRAAWPATVSEATWRTAAALLADPARRTSTGNRAEYLLSGIALCGREGCGRPVMSGSVVRRGSSPDRPTYRCRYCRRLSRRRDWVDDLVSSAVLRRLARPDAADLLLDHDRPDFDALEDAERDLRRQLDDAAAAYAEKAITISQLRTITGTLRPQLERIERQRQHVDHAPLLRPLIEADDKLELWESERFGLHRRRAVVQVMMKVTLLPGGVSGLRTFDPTLVRIDWVR